MADKYAPRLKAVYDETIAKAMVEKFGYKNVMEVPRIEKIVLNMGVGEATQDKKKVTSAAEEMELIAGQKPVITKARSEEHTSELQSLMRISYAVFCLKKKKKTKEK